MSKVFLARAMPLLQVIAQSGSLNSTAVEIPSTHLPAVLDMKNGLACSYVYDDGGSWVYVSQADLDELHAPVEGLHEVSLVNLAQLASNRVRMQTYGSIYPLLLDGKFEASLLLLDDLWDGPLRKQAPNGPVAALPARDVLAFADSGSLNGIDELSQLVGRVYRTGDHTISDQLYRREGGLWVQWRP